MTSVFNASIGFIVGNGGVIYKTTNGGLNWTAQTSTTISSLTSIFYADQNTGWAIGPGGLILKTTNGGTTWSAQTSTTTVDLLGVYAINTTTAYVVGASGKILYTTNGGTTWTSQVSGTSNNLLEVKFTDSATGYIVGQSGTILKTTNGGLSVDEISTTNSKSTISPNPFKNSFTVKMENGQTLSNATLTISTLLGSTVKVVKELNGSEFFLDGLQLNSGIYLYSITENEKLITSGKIIAE